MDRKYHYTAKTLTKEELDTGFFKILENDYVFIENGLMLDFYIDFFSNFNCKLFTIRVNEGNKTIKKLVKLNEDDLIFYKNFFEYEIEKYDDATKQKLYLFYEIFQNLGVGFDYIRMIKHSKREKETIESYLNNKNNEQEINNTKRRI